MGNAQEVCCRKKKLIDYSAHSILDKKQVPSLHVPLKVLFNRLLFILSITFLSLVTNEVYL